MDSSPSWEANSRSATREFPNNIWKLKVHYLVHQSTPVSPTWGRWMQSIPSCHISVRSILILSCNFRPRRPNDVFPSGFDTHLRYALPFRLMCASCAAHLTAVDLIIMSIFGEEYKSRSSSLRNILQPPIISPLLGPNICLSALV
jgi:hypothetical protein